MLRYLTSIAFLWIAACGAATTTRMRNEAHCCMNGVFYSCPDLDAAVQCVQRLSPGMCRRDSFSDTECTVKDSGF